MEKDKVIEKAIRKTHRNWKGFIVIGDEERKNGVFLERDYFTKLFTLVRYYEEENERKAEVYAITGECSWKKLRGFARACSKGRTPYVWASMVKEEQEAKKDRIVAEEKNWDGEIPLP